MAKLKLKVVLVPSIYSGVASSQLEFNQSRRFLHLTDFESNLGNVCEELVKRYNKLYPNDTELSIRTLQDDDRCDLDPDFQVSDVFASGDILRVVINNSLNPMNNTTSTFISSNESHELTPHVMKLVDLNKETQSTPILKPAPVLTQDSILPPSSRKRTQDFFEKTDTHIPMKVSRKNMWSSRNSSAMDVSPSAIDETPKLNVQKQRLPQAMGSPPQDQNSDMEEGHEESHISLPPPHNGNDRSIPQKKESASKPNDQALPGKKRITSGMLNIPPHAQLEKQEIENEALKISNTKVDTDDMSSDEVDQQSDTDTHEQPKPKGDTISPLGDNPQAQPVDTDALNSDEKPLEDMEETITKAEIISLFKNGMKIPAKLQNRLHHKLKGSKSHQEKNLQALMKNLEIDMINSPNPILSTEEKRATRAAAKKAQRSVPNKSTHLNKTASKYIGSDFDDVPLSKYVSPELTPKKPMDDFNSESKENKQKTEPEESEQKTIKSESNIAQRTENTQAKISPQSPKENIAIEKPIERVTPSFRAPFNEFTGASKLGALFEKMKQFDNKLNSLNKRGRSSSSVSQRDIDDGVELKNRKNKTIEPTVNISSPRKESDIKTSNGDLKPPKDEITLKSNGSSSNETPHFPIPLGDGTNNGHSVESTSITQGVSTQPATAFAQLPIPIQNPAFIQPPKASTQPAKALVEPAKAPVQPATAPVQPATTPVQPAKSPVQPATTPVQPAKAPVQPATAPVQPAKAPVQPATTPVQPAKAAVEPAKIAAQSPKVTAQYPKVTAQYPKAAAQSAKAVQSPKVPVQSPKVPVQSPKVPVQSPKVPVQSPKASVQPAKSAFQSPKTSASSSKSSTQSHNSSEQSPKDSTQLPKDTIRHSTDACHPPVIVKPNANNKGKMFTNPAAKSFYNYNGIDISHLKSMTNHFNAPGMKSNEASQQQYNAPPVDIMVAAMFNEHPKLNRIQDIYHNQGQRKDEGNGIPSAKAPLAKENDRVKENERSSKASDEVKKRKFVKSESSSESSASSSDSSDSSDESSDFENNNSDVENNRSENKRPRLAAAVPSLKYKAGNSSQARGSSISKTYSSKDSPKENYLPPKRSTLLDLNVPQSNAKPNPKGSQSKPQSKNNRSSSVPKYQEKSNIKKPILTSLNDLAMRGVPDVESNTKTNGYKTTKTSKNNVTGSTDESSSESSSSSSSEDESEDSEPDTSGKFINIKQLNKPKRRKGGFSALMKDAKKL